MSSPMHCQPPSMWSLPTRKLGQVEALPLLLVLRAELEEK